MSRSKKLDHVVKTTYIIYLWFLEVLKKRNLLKKDTSLAKFQKAFQGFLKEKNKKQTIEVELY